MNPEIRILISLIFLLIGYFRQDVRWNCMAFGLLMVVCITEPVYLAEL